MVLTEEYCPKCKKRVEMEKTEVWEKDWKSPIWVYYYKCTICKSEY